MWPFRRGAPPTIASAITQAAGFAAECWSRFTETSGLPRNINLRDRVSYFAADFRRELDRRYPLLRSAPEEIVLLVIAQGIERSGSDSRRLIELQLGIVLPD